MACEHKHLRCTNGEFFCLDCGKHLRWPTEEELFPGAKKIYLKPPKKAPEAAEPPKRKTRKRSGSK